MKRYLTENNSIKVIITGFVIIFLGIFIFIWYQLSNFRISSFDTEKFSQFGGFIGGVVGSLWSLAGFILFYVALGKQKDDLEINRNGLKAQIDALNQQTEEFKAQKEELEETRKVYKEQSKTQTLQRFENTFFNMLTLHHQIVEAIDLDYKEFLGVNSIYDVFLRNSNERLRIGSEIYKSRDVFKATYLHLEYVLKNDYHINIKKEETVVISLDSNNNNNNFAINKSEFKKLNFIDIESETNFGEIYLFFYNKLNTDFGHYFRNLYRMIKMIDEQKFGEETFEKEFEKKYYYTSIIRAQLSDYEIKWLFFNCIFNYGEKFKPLLEKYSFFKILNKTNVDVLKHYKKHYAESAFNSTFAQKISHF
jgi:hypothetical protein